MDKQIASAFKLISELQPNRERLMNPVPNTFNPFWNHPYNVLKNVIQLGFSDKNTLLAAILHDVLEDTDLPEEKIESEYGKEVLDIVKTVSKPKNYTKESAENYYKGIYGHKNKAIRKKACAIKIADRMDNLSEASIISSYEFAKGYLEETKEHYPKIAKVIKKEKLFKTFLKEIEILISMRKK